MRFLLNNHVVEIEAPEWHLDRYWKRLGCGDPSALSAEQAVQFAVMVVNDCLLDGQEIADDTKLDLAALIISKTGANAALFDGTNSARLDRVSSAILERLAGFLAGGQSQAISNYWTEAA